MRLVYRCKHNTSDGKDINVTLEDAVVSWEELRIIQGGQMRNAGNTVNGETVKVTIHRTADKVFKAGEEIEFPTGLGGEVNGKHNFPVTAPVNFQYLNMDEGLRGSVKSGVDSLNGAVIGASVPAGETRRIRFFWDEERDGQNDQIASEIVISPNTFPGTLFHDRAPRRGIKIANQFCELLEAVA